MLIASFSFTIDDYREKAAILWKFGRFHLIRSFAEKPVMPPPLSFFELIFINPTVFGGCKNRKWSNSLETHLHEEVGNDAPIGPISGDLAKENCSALAKFRYRELNGIEKTAVSKILNLELNDYKPNESAW